MASSEDTHTPQPPEPMERHLISRIAERVEFSNLLKKLLSTSKLTQVSKLRADKSEKFTEC